MDNDNKMKLDWRAVSLSLVAISLLAGLFMFIRDNDLSVLKATDVQAIDRVNGLEKKIDDIDKNLAETNKSLGRIEGRLGINKYKE